MTLNYNAPADGQQSSIDASGNSEQMRTFYWMKRSMIDAAKEQYFTQLANAEDMPKNFGKKIKVYYYVPLLDDRNVNDQGIDAQGLTIANGNLYGSSRDVGTITGKLPSLTENGGRVNRVGFTRLEREGSIENFGYFYEFTQDSMQFDSDEQLKQHLASESTKASSQMSEAQLQADLLNFAGTVIYAGVATAVSEITGEGDDPSVVSIQNISRLSRILTDNRTPTSTKIITGSRYIDTKVIGAKRVMYVGQQVKQYLEGMKDQFDKPALIEVQHYAAASTLLHGEFGSIKDFRLVLVPEMQHWAAAGAEATSANPGYSTSNDASGTERYDVFPMLVVGDDSFSTIGFQTDGKSLKYNIITKMPGILTADRNDPYGKTGFTSVQWWYGFLGKRSERVGVIKTVAPV